MFFDVLAYNVTIQSMSIAYAKKMKTKMIFHIWLNYERILILLIWISWLMTHTCCKSKLGDAIKSIGCLLWFWLNNTWLIFFWHWMSCYLLGNLIISKYIWIEIIKLSLISNRCLNLVFKWNSVWWVVWKLFFNLLNLFTSWGWFTFHVRNECALYLLLGFFWMKFS